MLVGVVVRYTRSRRYAVVNIYYKLDRLGHKPLGISKREHVVGQLKTLLVGVAPRLGLEYWIDSEGESELSTTIHLSSF